MLLINLTGRTNIFSVGCYQCLYNLEYGILGRTIFTILNAMFFVFRDKILNKVITMNSLEMSFHNSQQPLILTTE